MNQWHLRCRLNSHHNGYWLKVDSLFGLVTLLYGSVGCPFGQAPRDRDSATWESCLSLPLFPRPHKYDLLDSTFLSLCLLVVPNVLRTTAPLGRTRNYTGATRPGPIRPDPCLVIPAFCSIVQSKCGTCSPRNFARTS